MLNYITGKFKKGFSIMEILIVVGLVAFMAVYAGLEMSRQAVDNDVSRMRGHLGQIFAGLDSLHGATADVQGATVATLCSGNYTIPSFCTTNTAGTFSGMKAMPSYSIGDSAANATAVTVTIVTEAGGSTPDDATANALVSSLNDNAISGVGAATTVADSGVVTFTYTAGTH